MCKFMKMEKISLQCEVTTPMFLGDANGDARLRGEPFKSMFRWWWRLTAPHLPVEKLLSEESLLFGREGAKDAGSGKSTVQVRVIPLDVTVGDKDHWPKIVKKINHPECSPPQIDPLLYLAGMGLMQGSNPKRNYINPGSRFVLELVCTHEIWDTIRLIHAFGTIGARCRNGWGSFTIANEELNLGTLNPQQIENDLNEMTKDWEDGFEKDYPNCLGRDEKGPLLWRTKDPKKEWHEAMADLATAYVKLRADVVGQFPKLNPDTKDYPDERHLLGFPLTNHPATKQNGWGNAARHASPLRFNVRKIQGKYHGFILHVPFRFSDKMPFPKPKDKDWQIKTWEKVHNKLDAITDILQRISYSRCFT